jgi:hypothetical protein
MLYNTERYLVKGLRATNYLYTSGDAIHCVYFFIFTTKNRPYNHTFCNTVTGRDYFISEITEVSKYLRRGEKEIEITNIKGNLLTTSLDILYISTIESVVSYLTVFNNESNEYPINDESLLERPIININYMYT